MYILLHIHTRDSLLIGVDASDVVQAQTLTLVEMSAQRNLTRIIIEVEIELPKQKESTQLKSNNNQAP